MKRLVKNINWHFAPVNSAFVGTEAFMVGDDYTYLPVSWYCTPLGYWIG